MKHRTTTIKKSDRTTMKDSGTYDICCLKGYDGHECAGRTTWEHTLIFKGQKLQEPWSIIPLCAKYHGVDEFQDAGNLNKELNIWVALNRATDQDLMKISKAVDYIRLRSFLNSKYGVWVQKSLQTVTAIKY